MCSFVVPDKVNKHWESDYKNNAHGCQLVIALLLLDYNDQRDIFICQAPCTQFLNELMIQTLSGREGRGSFCNV